LKLRANVANVVDLEQTDIAERELKVIFLLGMGITEMPPRELLSVISHAVQRDSMPSFFSLNCSQFPSGTPTHKACLNDWHGLWAKIPGSMDGKYCNTTWLASARAVLDNTQGWWRWFPNSLANVFSWCDGRTVDEAALHKIAGCSKTESLRDDNGLKAWIKCKHTQKAYKNRIMQTVWFSALAVICTYCLAGKSKESDTLLYLLQDGEEDEPEAPASGVKPKT